MLAAPLFFASRGIFASATVPYTLLQLLRRSCQLVALAGSSDASSTNSVFPPSASTPDDDGHHLPRLNSRSQDAQLESARRRRHHRAARRPHLLLPYVLRGPTEQEHPRLNLPPPHRESGYVRQHRHRLDSARRATKLRCGTNDAADLCWRGSESSDRWLVQHDVRRQRHLVACRCRRRGLGHLRLGARVLAGLLPTQSEVC